MDSPYAAETSPPQAEMSSPHCIAAALSGRAGWICQLKLKPSLENRLVCISTASHSAPLFPLQHTHIHMLWLQTMSQRATRRPFAAET